MLNNFFSTSYQNKIHYYFMESTVHSFVLSSNAKFKERNEKTSKKQISN